MQLGEYPTPLNLSYAWSFGSLSGLTMVGQAGTGVELDTTYVAEEGAGPGGLEALEHDGPTGGAARAAHANVPSALFGALYAHQARSGLIGTRAAWSWLSGWVLLVLTIVVAFLGYSCAWAQMSYWAATVITSLLTVVPSGPQLLDAVWGGPTVGQATLSRFMAAHFAAALVALALAGAHVIAVHYVGSSGPHLGYSVEKGPFMLYFALKDALPLGTLVLVALGLLAMAPTAALDAELFAPVNSMATPEHIVPEWYLVGYYAVLRGVPSKPLGCVAAGGLLVLLLLTALKSVSSGRAFVLGTWRGRYWGGVSL